MYVKETTKMLSIFSWKTLLYERFPKFQCRKQEKYANAEWIFVKHVLALILFRWLLASSLVKTGDGATEELCIRNYSSKTFSS